MCWAATHLFMEGYPSLNKPGLCGVIHSTCNDVDCKHSWNGLGRSSFFFLDRPLGFFARRTLAVWYGFRLGSGLVLRGSQPGYWVDFRGHAVNFFFKAILDCIALKN